jgi:hypothetical protein
MAEETFIDKISSWLQSHPILMLLLGALAIIWSFGGSARYQAFLCISSGLVIFFTGLHERYYRIRIGRIASMRNLLEIFGLWPIMIGIFNIDGNPSFLLPYTSFATGLVAIFAFIMTKIPR